MMRDCRLIGSVGVSAQPPDRLSMELSATSLGVRQALRRLELFLRPSGIAPAQQGTIELVLAEVLNNIAEHACGVDDRIRVSIRIDGKIVDCVVRDRGRAFPASCFAPAAPPVPATLPEGGFGLHIIRSLADDLHYCRRFDENRLTFRIDLGDESP